MASIVWFPVLHPGGGQRRCPVAAAEVMVINGSATSRGKDQIIVSGRSRSQVTQQLRYLWGKPKRPIPISFGSLTLSKAPAFTTPDEIAIEQLSPKQFHHYPEPAFCLVFANVGKHRVVLGKRPSTPMLYQPIPKTRVWFHVLQLLQTGARSRALE